MPKIYDSLIRVSKLGSRIVSADSTMTIDDQRDANVYAIGRADGALGRELRADDQSGYSVTESPQWKEALRRCEAGESHGIVVAYGDRLTRNWRAIGAFYDRLEACGAEVIIAAMPGVDFRTPEGRVTTGMLAIMGDMQYQAAKVRGERIADRTMARGVPNRVPYGYRRNEQTGVKVDAERDAKALVPDPDTAQWVKLIFRHRAARWSWGNIADELDRLGVLGPTGKGWGQSTLSAIIANRAYLGVVTLGKRVVEDAHEPLVDLALWREAQSTQRAPTRTGRLRGGLAAGLLMCSGCGERLQVVSANTNRAPRTMYACSRRRASGRCARPVAISKERVDTAVEKWILDGMSGEDPFDIFVGARELEVARIAVERANAQLAQLLKTVATWDPDDAKVAYDAAKAGEADARAHYDQLAARADEAAALPDSPNAWYALGLDAQRRVLRLLVDRIDVAPPLSRSKFADVTARLTLKERRHDGHDG